MRLTAVLGLLFISSTVFSSPCDTLGKLSSQKERSPLDSVSELMALRGTPEYSNALKNFEKELYVFFSSFDPIKDNEKNLENNKRVQEALQLLYRNQRQLRQKEGYDPYNDTTLNATYRVLDSFPLSVASLIDQELGRILVIMSGPDGFLFREKDAVETAEALTRIVNVMPKQALQMNLSSYPNIYIKTLQRMKSGSLPKDAYKHFTMTDRSIDVGIESLQKLADAVNRRLNLFRP